MERTVINEQKSNRGPYFGEPIYTSDNTTDFREDPYIAAWHEGIAARRRNTKLSDNPYRRAPGSHEDNFWRAGWMGEDHFLRQALRA